MSRCQWLPGMLCTSCLLFVILCSILSKIVLFYLKCSRQSCQNIDSYKRAVAFVMAYSFTEPPSLSNDDESSSDDDSDNEDEAKTTSSPPMMVPMADILNHVAKNNARLDFGIDSLKMVATKSINTVNSALSAC